MSQRGYKNVKKILKNQDIILPTYDSVRNFLKNLDVGVIERCYCKCQNDVCFSCQCSVTETLKLFLANSFWMEKLKFPTQLQQEQLFSSLKSLNNELYGNLDPNLRTLYLRLTGDNFRGSAKFPTEQISFSILNNVGMLHSPYGQFIASLWRGSESRLNVQIHVSEHYNYPGY